MSLFEKYKRTHLPAMLYDHRDHDFMGFRIYLKQIHIVNMFSIMQTFPFHHDWVCSPLYHFAAHNKMNLKGHVNYLHFLPVCCSKIELSTFTPITHVMCIYKTIEI